MRDKAPVRRTERGHAIRAVPAQLAARLPADVLRTGSTVTAVTEGGVLISGGGEVAAGAVVVATGQLVAAEPLPGLCVLQGRTVTALTTRQLYLPLVEPGLVVGSRRRFLDMYVLTPVQARLSSGGRSPVSTSVLGSPAPDRDRNRPTGMGPGHKVGSVSGFRPSFPAHGSR
ncbi:hypothetical protein [Streptomyces gardneri]|uniref:hypothetical protein n=1 Tax=Streptomyces gardneri TaxID=66892 RepID=UPI0037D63642